MSDRGWWTISGDDLFAAMQRAHEGQDPELIYMELYANSDVSRYTRLGEGNCVRCGHLTKEHRDSATIVCTMPDCLCGHG